MDLHPRGKQILLQQTGHRTIVFHTPPHITAEPGRHPMQRVAVGARSFAQCASAATTHRWSGRRSSLNSPVEPAGCR